MVLSTESGTSSTTAHASAFYITKYLPKVITLEFLDNEQYATFMLYHIRKTRKYDVEVFKCQIQDLFKCPVSRNRMYIIGVNLSKVALKQPVHTWVQDIVNLCMIVPDTKAEDYLLPDHDPYIVDELLDLEAKAREPTEEDVKSWMGSEGFIQPQHVRTALRIEHFLDVPSWQEMLQIKTPV